jgi:hypothetical protein
MWLKASVYHGLVVLKVRSFEFPCHEFQQQQAEIAGKDHTKLRYYTIKIQETALLNRFDTPQTR